MERLVSEEHRRPTTISQRAWRLRDRPDALDLQSGPRPKGRSATPRIVAIVGTIAFLLASCGSSSATSFPVASRQSTASPYLSEGPRSTPAPEPTLASSFGDLPYQLDLPGWTFRTEREWTTILANLRASDPAMAASIESLGKSGPAVSNEFVAVRSDDPSVILSGSSVGTSGCATAAVLQELEVENVSGVKKMQWTVGIPTSDRVTLPIGGGRPGALADEGLERSRQRRDIVDWIRVRGRPDRLQLHFWVPCDEDLGPRIDIRSDHRLVQGPSRRDGTERKSSVRPRIADFGFVWASCGS